MPEMIRSLRSPACAQAPPFRGEGQWRPGPGFGQADVDRRGNPRPGRGWTGNRGVALASLLVVGVALAAVAASLPGAGDGAAPAPPQPPAGQPLPGEAVVLDARTFPYLEDEHGPPGRPRRALAGIDVRLETAGDGERIVIVARATGDEVQPPPGFEHVAGTNLITARELARILDGRDTLEVATVGEEGARAGTYRAGRVGRMRTRQVLPEGRFAFRAETEELPLELVLDSGALPAGRNRTEIRLNGDLRLWVAALVEDGSSRILDAGVFGPSTPSGDLQ